MIRMFVEKKNIHFNLKIQIFIDTLNKIKLTWNINIITHVGEGGVQRTSGLKLLRIIFIK